MELLTVVAIIGILAGLSLVAVGRVRAAAADAQCKSILRQWGVGIQLYANDHGDRLPGPCLGLMLPKVNADQLVTYVAPYLGLELQSNRPLPESFICSGWSRQTRSKDAPFYALRSDIPPPSGSGSWIRPFGYPGTYDPMRFSHVATLLDMSRTAIMTEVDATCLASISAAVEATYGSKVPPQPVHGTHRNVLYFDGHVGRVQATEQMWP